MAKNPVALIGVALVAALLTLGLVFLISPDEGKQAPLKPLEVPAGESLRLQATKEKPRPAPANPAEVARSLEGQTLLPGDAVLAQALKAALAAGESPSYKIRIDVPLEDNAAQAVRDEVKAWVERKMAALGFTLAAGKPSLTWVVHVDPADGGKYVVKTILRTEGQERFNQAFELPFAFSADRVEKSLGAAYATP
ncbi:MAG: hypothetical protein ACOX6T_13685 [Myxococcales bacterium]|jgi:hypothetical protein